MIISIVLGGAIASRAPFLRDRVAFGVVTGEMILRLITALAPLAPSITFFINVLRVLIWAVGAAACLLFFISASRQRTS
jgi:hypothetical protein